MSASSSGEVTDTGGETGIINDGKWAAEKLSLPERQTSGRSVCSHTDRRIAHTQELLRCS